jgi:hypothetical protein
MIELMPQMTERDLIRSYHRTFLKFKTRDSDCFYPAQVAEVTETEDGIFLTLRKATGEYIIVPAYDPEECVVDVSWPDLGFINYKTATVNLSRKAETQWKRGMRSDQISKRFVSPDIASEYYDLESENYLYTNEFIEGLYYPEYPKYQEAAYLVLEGKAISKAINKDFALANVYGINKPVIQFRNYGVGVIEDDYTIALHSKAHQLLETIEDLTNGYRTRILPT